MKDGLTNSLHVPVFANTFSNLKDALGTCVLFEEGQQKGTTPPPLP